MIRQQYQTRCNRSAERTDLPAPALRCLENTMRHRSLIAVLGSSPLGELFYACVSDGSCAYQVSVLSGVGMCRPMMVSEVPASECQVRGSCDPEITAAPMPTRSPSPRPGKSCSPPNRGGTCRGRIRKPSRQPPCSTSGTRCHHATSGGE